MNNTIFKIGFLVGLFLIIIGCSLFSREIAYTTGYLPPNITRSGGGIRVDNENYTIDWELEITGHTPYNDNKYILEGNALISKGIDRTVDIAFISPSPLNPGNKVYIWKDVNHSWIESRYLFCTNKYSSNPDNDLNLSAKYGWVVVGESVYCNITHPIFEDETNTTIIGYYDIKYVHDIEQPYSFDNSELPENVSIQWNKTFSRISEDKIDVTPSFTHTTKDIYLNGTYLGNEVYYVDDVTFKADRPYQFRLEVNVNESYVPFKYSVCFGDIQGDKLYFCLDPVITGFRTWTDNDDFTNNTVIYNLTTSGDNIVLSPGQVVQFNWTFPEPDACSATGLTNWDGVSAADCTDGWFVSDTVLQASWAKNVSLPHDEDIYIRGKIWFDTTNARRANIGIANESTGVDYQDQQLYFQFNAQSTSVPVFESGVYIGNAGTINPSNEDWAFVEIHVHTNKSVDVYFNQTDGIMNYIGTVTMTNSLQDISDWLIIHSFTYDGNPSDGSTRWDEIAVVTGDAQYLTRGEYLDLQNWTTGTTFDNISIELTNTSTSEVAFANSSDNTTFSWTTLTNNGTNVVPLGGDTLFYKFQINDSSGTESPSITSYTIYETAGDPTQLTDCAELNLADTEYTLTQNIPDSSDLRCMNVTAENVTLNCAEFNIDGIDAANSYGIYSEKLNTTVKGCNISDWYFGIFYNYSIMGTIRDSTFDSHETGVGATAIAMDFANGTLIENVTITDGKYGILNDESWYVTVRNATIDNQTTVAIFFDMDPDHSIIENVTITQSTQGINLNYADNVTVRDNRIYNSSDSSLEFNHFGQCSASEYAQDCSGWDYTNKIYNNLFNSSDNIDQGVYDANKWNTTIQAGTRIYSNGTQIAGNYWTTPTGGFSDDCADADKDGFCDDGYNVTNNAGCVLGSTCGNNADLKPYSDEYSSFAVTECGNLDAASTTYTMTQDVFAYTSESGETFCLNITASDVTLDCAGYTIKGNGSYLAEDWGPGRAVGINIGNVSNITVKSCYVTNFSQAIFAENVSGSSFYDFNVNSTGSIPMDYAFKGYKDCFNNSIYNWTAEDVIIGISFYNDSTYNDVQNITIIKSFNSAHNMITLAWNASYNSFYNISVDQGYNCLLIYSGSNYNTFDSFTCTNPLNNGLWFYTSPFTGSSVFNNLTNFFISGVDTLNKYGVLFYDASANNTLVNFTFSDNLIDIGLISYTEESDTNVFYGNEPSENLTMAWCDTLNKNCGGTLTMSNTSDGAIALKTAVFNQSAISGTFIRVQRNITSWAQDNVGWSDITASGDILYNYTLTGLLGSTVYEVYNNSVLLYDLTTDAGGTLPMYNISTSGDGNNITVSEAEAVGLSIDITATNFSGNIRFKPLFASGESTSYNVIPEGQSTNGSFNLTNTGDGVCDVKFVWGGLE